MRSAKPTEEIDLDPRSARRERRAEAVRRKALSPLRILIMVLALPLTTGLIAVSVYLRVTDYDRHDAVIHLVALAGCDAAGSIGLGPFREGQAGYHKRNDPDGDGVACGSTELGNTPLQIMSGPAPTSSTAPRAEAPKQRMVGNAKFLKP